MKQFSTRAEMQYNIHTLSNGLRIIHEPSSSKVAYCGFAVDAGTRDEAENEQGMAHFVEHLIFKGTRKRKAWHILNRMENVGGDLNAYTNKEETVIYSAFLTEHFGRALELLADIVFHSTFPQKENGGHVIGVVPSKLEENGKESTYPDEIIATHDLSDRKDIILQQSDVLVALPGGIGTLDEVFHVMAAASIGYHQKKVIFYNADGFYNPLLAVLSELQTRGFTRHPLSSYYEVANTFNELTIKI